MKWYPQLDEFYSLFYSKLFWPFELLNFFFSGSLAAQTQWLHGSPVFWIPALKSHQKEPLGAGEMAQWQSTCWTRARKGSLRLGAPAPTGQPTGNLSTSRPRQGLLATYASWISKLKVQRRNLALVHLHVQTHGNMQMHMHGAAYTIQTNKHKNPPGFNMESPNNVSTWKKPSSARLNELNSWLLSAVWSRCEQRTQTPITKLCGLPRRTGTGWNVIFLLCKVGNSFCHIIQRILT